MTRITDILGFLPSPELVVELQRYKPATGFYLPVDKNVKKPFEWDGHATHNVGRWPQSEHVLV